MAAPQPAIALPAEIKHHSLALDTKPGASIHYTFAHSRKPSDPLLVVFLNGLMTDKSSWLPTMAGIIRADPDFPSMAMGTPVSLSMKYSNPAWHEYNQGLAKLTDVERAKGPIIAPGCGHFVQRDNPGFVVQEVLQMWKNIQRSSIMSSSKATGA